LNFEHHTHGGCPQEGRILQHPQITVTWNKRLTRNVDEISYS